MDLDLDLDICTSDPPRLERPFVVGMKASHVRRHRLQLYLIIVCISPCSSTAHPPGSQICKIFGFGSRSPRLRRAHFVRLYSTLTVRDYYST